MLSMGYILDKNTTFNHDLCTAQHTGDGTLTYNLIAANVWSVAVEVPTGVAGDFTLKTPLNYWSSTETQKGCWLKSISAWYYYASAIVTRTLTPALYILTLPRDGSAFTAAAVSTTFDTAHDTNAERVIAQYHKITFTLAAPYWIDPDDSLFIEWVNVDYYNSLAIIKFDVFNVRSHVDLRI
jgi:hypothetical protein